MSGAGKSIRCGIGALALVTGSGIGLFEHAAAGEMSFTVTIEQLTTEETLKLPDGSATRAPISPGTAVVYRGANPLFTVGQPASPGLQRQAEAGQPEGPDRCNEGSRSRPRGRHVRADGQLHHRRAAGRPAELRHHVRPVE
jgi:hypothetical protein